MTTLGRAWGSTEAERAMAFPCDRHLAGPDDVLFRAVSMEAPAPALFRWVCQLRVAPYSYDWIDNLGRRSPRGLIPGLEALERGQRFMRTFRLVDFERDRHVTLFARGGVLGSIALTYLVVPVAGTGSRLVVKMLVAYPRVPLLRSLARAVLPWGDLVMMRKQLLTLKHLAERPA